MLYMMVLVLVVVVSIYLYLYIYIYILVQFVCHAVMLSCYYVLLLRCRNIYVYAMSGAIYYVPYGIISRGAVC